MEIEEGETVVLLGTSGSGKTTTMKMVNRLVEPTSGTILINGKDIIQQDSIHLRRMIGYAIQHIGLFPHMTVAENIAIVPKLLKWPVGQIVKRVKVLLAMVGLEPDDFRVRYPAQLSGGQRQRVGVARALAADPPIVLMDEPFGALDPITREQLQNEFIELLSEIKKTIIFVTHDVFEAVKMGDRIALLDAGRLQQLATPTELIEEPANEFVDQFLGQHRFQLSLLTRTVETIMPETDQNTANQCASVPSLSLRAKSSLVEALDIFKKSGEVTLPVYERQHFVGILGKSQLLKAITQILGGIPQTRKDVFGGPGETEETL
ncbi:MAG: ATP-binding cassette domain-containing protein [Phycisphaerae bacterium]|nr:ATP-binding cassette domain-containing protein [Phycisphaerae bacterium]NIV14061.1 ATP-binding cassette domain-containing protein [Fodinibius sp.]NIW92615.1 ATP-binding cassette domain-containing protein [Phycisphaerae bacterium]